MNGASHGDSRRSGANGTPSISGHAQTYSNSLANLPSEVRELVERLALAGPAEDHLSLPRESLAGVLVLLCPPARSSSSIGLDVILTTRALHMRSYPGETALPGGRMESYDIDIAATALREAHEEIGLPLEDERISVLTTLPPYLSKNLLFVIPVVAFIDVEAEELRKTLKANADEVGGIWSWPLEDMLGRDVQTGEHSTNSENERNRYTYKDVNWLLGRPYRLHSFDHPRMGSPITGLTADILISVATSAYGISEGGLPFEVSAPRQLTNAEMVQAVLDGRAGAEGDERSFIRKPKAPLVILREDTNAMR